MISKLNCKIISWNVNSIRVRLDHINKLIKNENPDIILIQETRVKNELYPQINNYYNYFFGNGGRNGVSILCKLNINNKLIYDNNDRIIGIHLIDFNYDIYSIYAPNGFSISSSVEHKIMFFDLLSNLKPTNNDTNIILGGDFNILYKETHTTLSNPYAFNEIEIYKQLNNIYFNPSHLMIDKYITWWAYFENSLKNNKGYGIDTFLIKNKIHNYDLKILKEYRYFEKPSDHAPIQLIIN